MYSISSRVAFFLIAVIFLFGDTNADESNDITSEPMNSIDVNLISHWTFDQVSGTQCLDSSGNGWHAEMSSPATPIVRRRGLFGNALSLSGNHMLRVSEQIPVAHPAGVSLSAWVKPTELSHYREIFRKEDGTDRVLFSFQNDGTILSLGLNIDGYVECDAKISPERVKDGRWHHCAATFDGRWMRVYLDGDEIGSLERPGKIRAGGSAPGCLGSSNGGECFQGTLDDLRIYGSPLSAVQIAQLYRQGLERIEQSSEDLVQHIRMVYQPGESFADTLMACRQRIVEQRLVLDPELAAAVTIRLKTDFPAQYGRFAEITGLNLNEFLSAGEPDAHLRQAQHLVDLLAEYKPLTDQQWQRQTPEQREYWKAVAEVAAQLERLQARESMYSPDWIAFLIEVAPQIQQRPERHERVAPYVRPTTPQTRTLTIDEARATLERDWLFQADGRPTGERICQEIQWTRELAARIQADSADVLAELKELERQATGLATPSPELYFRVRQLKRNIVFSNPLLDFDKILMVDMPYPQGNEWRHETRHRLGYMAVPGGRLLILDGLSPAGELKQLMPQSPLHGTFWRPDLSFDAQKVVFCYKPHNEKSFHLYEINIDGTGLVQLTDGPYDDFDPIYLQDEQHLMFSTTRGHSYVRCMPPTNAFVLARCDRDGKNIYLVSANNEPDYLPSLMNDGRVIYTRWEYTDKPLWRAQKLWTINPDGTQVLHYWGNQSVWPDLMKDARSIPGSSRVMFTGSAHHNWFSGSVGIIDPDDGYNFPDGITKITADVAWPEVGNGPVDPIESPDYHRSGNYPAYYSPYPLSEQDFLVSAERNGKFSLYLMDVYGNRELVYEGVHNIFHAMPLKPRPKPPQISDRVVWPNCQQRQTPQDGIIFSGNVYQGAPVELQGKARHLRVLHIDPKTYTYWYKRPYISTGPVVSTVQSEGVKRILGTVPIEADGSVAFRAPPGKALHFQLLDEHYRALQTMRSFVGLMPGESRGCLGCHEGHSRAPQVELKSLAVMKEPPPITPPPWGEDTVSYARYVQPVLEQHCGKCHQGDGVGVKEFDVTPRPGFLDFAEPYHVMTGRPTWGRPYEKPQNASPGWGIAGMLMVEGYGKTDPEAYRAPPPMVALSYRSRLIDLCSSGEHYDVKVDPIGLRKLIAWVDAMCPYNGDQEVRAIDDPVFQGVDWLSIRPRIKTAPKIIRPGPVD